MKMRNAALEGLTKVKEGGKGFLQILHVARPILAMESVTEDCMGWIIKGRRI